MGTLILDASVVIALLDSGDKHHERAVDQLAEADEAGHDLAMPASAYAEALVAPARAGRVDDARHEIEGAGIAVAELTAGMATAAALLRARHKHLGLADALVVACARHLQARLLTFDRRLAAVAGRQR